MRLTAALLLLLALASLPLAGCGGGEEVTPTAETVEDAGPTGTETETTAEESQPAAQGDPQAGEEVFASAGCGGCHTLEEAGSSGTVGPNLDESAPSYEEIVETVTNGRDGMPSFKDRLSQEQIRNVSAFVSQAVGGGGG